MKKTLLIIILSFLFFTAFAQQQTGTVLYERYSRMSWGIKQIPENMLSSVPSYVVLFDLTFAPKISLFKQTDDPVMLFEPETGIMQAVESAYDGEQLTDIILFSDREKNITVEEAEFLGKNFLISDSIRRLSWKISNETKKIAGYNCQKAVTEKIEVRRSRRRSYADTATTYLRRDTTMIVAWFAPDIPVSTGPEEFTGQLPGLILEMNIGKGNMIYRAKTVNTMSDKEEIKPPLKGKKVTAMEFANEKDKMLKEMYLREEREFKRPGPKG